MSARLLIGILITVAVLSLVAFQIVSKMKASITSTASPTLFPTSKVSPTTESSLSGMITEVSKNTIKLSKSSYRIALYGDSLIDTMVDAPENVESVLKSTYPQNLFKVYNYGIGAQNVQDGLNRWDSQFSNRDRVYPAVKDINADVIIIGSFAYNPFSPHDRAKHKQLLSDLVGKAKQTDARVFMLAEIAPLGDEFGKGPKGVNWGAELSKEHARHIIEQIQDVFSVAEEQNVPVVDVFSISKVPGSEFGRRELVNIDDGIHPSPEGHYLTAKTIVEKIKLK